MTINDLYQELIIDHGTQPRNCQLLPKATSSAEGHNPLCGDQLHLYLNIVEQQIAAISFQGQGCVISMASTSLMTELLKGKTVQEAQQLCDQFQQLMTSDTLCPSSLGKLTALSGVRAYPTRIKCATLAWHVLQAALKQDKSKVSTE